MIFYTAEDIARITEGNILNSPAPGAKIKNIVIDSRTVTDGGQAVFFAIRGNRNDGHDYLNSVVKKGVAAVVVSKIPSRPDSFSECTIIKVNDTLKALQLLAAYHRQQFSYPVIGITGSNGKTIVKEWLYDLLNNHFSIIRSPKSYNSQVGVPLSVWLMNAGYDLAIFEAGISMPGEMGRLEEIISPGIGIFTNIGTAHQENFNSIRQKTEEKITLFRNSEKLVFCADQGETSEVVETFCDFHKIEKISWSLKGNPAAVQFSAKTNNATTITARIGSEEYSFSIPFTDTSSIENACHCFAAVHALGVPAREITGKFVALESVAMRLEIKKGKNNCLLINDFYNSDINALSIALTTLKNQASKGFRNKILILSDIKQSGFNPSELYSMVNDMLHKSGASRIIGIGPDLLTNRHLFNVEKEFYRDTADFIKKFNDSSLTDSAILLKGAREFGFEKISAVLQEKAHQTVLETDLNSLIENLNTYRALLKPQTKIMAMVKAFSYGSGTDDIARSLAFHGVDYLAVAVADEGVELRKSGITTPIVVMNPEPVSFQNMFDYKLEPNIYSFQLLNEFSKAAKYQALVEFPIHIKIDTGMNRLGFKTEEEIGQATGFIKKSGNLKIASVFSHLAASDDPSFDSFTENQIKHFEKLSLKIISGFSYKILRHILNSAGIERFNKTQYDMVRLGIGLYGVGSAGLKLKQVGTLKTTVSQVKEVSAGETVGYSRQGKVLKPSRIAVIPVGYADGLTRSLGNLNGRAYLNGSFAPIIGNICMDMCMLDVTGIKADVGDTVELFGPHIPVTELAEKTGTIPYEILSGISQRVKRVYLQE